MLGRQCLYFAFLPWTLEAAGLQTLVQKNKSVALPVQGLNPVTAPATEQKQRVGEWIQVELLLDHGGQPVDPTAQVGVAAGDVHPVGSIKVGQHDFRIRSTASTVAASAPL